MHQIASKKSRELRWGFSTGTYLAALCCATYRNYTTGWQENKIAIIFPDKKIREIQLKSIQKNSASAIKEAGDDPDITNGAIIEVEIRNPTPPISEKDYTLQIENGIVHLQGKSGIGLCTREGLPCPKGKWAINPVPIQMVIENLQRYGFGKQTETVHFSISVQDGEKLAQKTLNPSLGIVGGISILGTTGLVRPYSHAAYIETIRMQIRGASLKGVDTLYFATGSRTAKTISRSFKSVDKEQIILIGDFIAEALQSAESEGISQVTLSCMPGKLNKYASGFANTHAHNNAQSLEILNSIAQKLFPQKESINRATPTVREALLPFTDQEQKELFTELMKVALTQLNNHAPTLTISLLLSDFKGETIL